MGYMMNYTFVEIMERDVLWFHTDFWIPVPWKITLLTAVFKSIQ